MTAIRRSSVSMPSAGGLGAGHANGSPPSIQHANEQLRGLSLNQASPAKPPRPIAPPVDEASDSEEDPDDLDEDNPFGDHAAIKS